LLLERPVSRYYPGANTYQQIPKLITSGLDLILALPAAENIPPLPVITANSALQEASDIHSILTH
jgi:hypothetical protein